MSGRFRVRTCRTTIRIRRRRGNGVPQDVIFGSYRTEAQFAIEAWSSRQVDDHDGRYSNRFADDSTSE